MELTDKLVDKLYKQKKSFNNFIYLGKGGTSIVYKYNNQNNHNNHNNHVLKIIDKDKFNQSEYNLSIYFNSLLDSNESINFLRVYNLYEFENYKVIEMELADGDLYNWIEKKNSDEEWIKMIIQLLITLRILQQKINFFHRDLKPKNILFKRLNTTNEFIYRLNNKDYKIIFNTIFYITDFTHSESDITDIKHKNKSKYINIDSDLFELENLPKRLKVDIIMKKYNLDDIIIIGRKSRLNENFTSYYNDEIKKTESKLKSYPKNIKDKFIKRSLIYYLLENKLIDCELDVMSNKIINILSELTMLDLDNKIEQIYNNLTSALK